MTICLFASLFKNPDAISYQTRQWRKGENGTTTLQNPKFRGSSFLLIPFFLFVSLYILDLLIPSYTGSYSKFIVCTCSVLVFSKLALNSIFVVILSATLPSNKPILSHCFILVNWGKIQFIIKTKGANLIKPIQP